MCDICNIIEKSLKGENSFFVNLELEQELLCWVGIIIFTVTQFLCVKGTQRNCISWMMSFFPSL